MDFASQPPAQKSLKLEDSSALRAARHITRRLTAAGYQAFFAGGCVRDLLLGRAAKDFDVATSATPSQISALFPRTIQVGAHFGVILVQETVDDALVSTEVATFRNDGVYLDGRRPDAVRFTTDPREDVLRRDFTINGMLLDPTLLRDAPDRTILVPVEAVKDFVGGQEDLARGLVRTIGDPDLRFREDKLRMLRGIRFAARLNFAIDPATLRAIQVHAAEISQVSSERIRDELTRMLTEGRARRAFELLDESGLLQQVLPEAMRMHGVEQPADWHPEGDVWVHTMLLLEKLRPGCSATLAWGALLHDIGKPATYQVDATGRIRFNGHVEVGVRMAEEILGRLRFSNDETTQIVALIKHHMRFGDLRAMKESTVRRFLRLPQFNEHLDLHWLDCTSCHGKLELYELAKARFEEEPTIAERLPLLVTGRDLIAAGYRPGPTFKQMLEAVEDAQLEGTISVREQGMQLVAARFGLSK